MNLERRENHEIPIHINIMAQNRTRSLKRRRFWFVFKILTKVYRCVLSPSSSFKLGSDRFLPRLFLVSTRIHPIIRV
jgi:ribosomal protein L39E